jgi:hypothetical protein
MALITPVDRRIGAKLRRVLDVAGPGIALLFRQYAEILLVEVLEPRDPVSVVLVPHRRAQHLDRAAAGLGGQAPCRRRPRFGDERDALAVGDAL